MLIYSSNPQYTISNTEKQDIVMDKDEDIKMFLELVR